MAYYGSKTSNVVSIENASFMAAFFTVIHLVYCTFKHVYRMLSEAWSESHVFKWPLRKWMYPCCGCSLVLIPVIFSFCMTVYVVFLIEPLPPSPTSLPTELLLTSLI